MTNESIDFAKLQQEFYRAQAADQKYSRENEAKFRAVHQKVASYEEFRDLVTTSHLKPLDRGDILGVNQAEQPWNRLYVNNNKQIDEKLNTPKLPPTTSHNTDTKHIKTRDEFLKNWKTSTDKMAYLLQFDNKFLVSVFQCDIPFNFLETVIDAVHEQLRSGHYLPGFGGVLLSFTGCERFGLTLKFLGKPEKERLKEIFLKMKENGYNTEELEKVYKF